MNWSLDDLLRGVPPQYGNGGRHLVPSGVFKDAPAAPATPIDKTTAAVRLILDAEASERAEKTARLKAAREARDQGLSEGRHSARKATFRSAHASLPDGKRRDSG